MLIIEDSPFPLCILGTIVEDQVTIHDELSNVLFSFLAFGIYRSVSSCKESSLPFQLHILLRFIHVTGSSIDQPQQSVGYPLAGRWVLFGLFLTCTVLL